jgi:hypothetical protein
MPHHTATLSQEWTTLQNNYEQAERSALLVKLAAVTLCVGGYALGVPYELIGGTALLLWIQESLCRTSQARLGERIVRVEALVKNAAPAASACQLHTEWLASRQGSVGLLAEYASHALRPTVAFPYAVLVAAALVAYAGQ